jgi:hypothetical protein
MQGIIRPPGSCSTMDECESHGVVQTREHRGKDSWRRHHHCTVSRLACAERS